MLIDLGLFLSFLTVQGNENEAGVVFALVRNLDHLKAMVPEGPSVLGRPNEEEGVPLEERWHQRVAEGQVCLLQVVHHCGNQEQWVFLSLERFFLHQNLYKYNITIVIQYNSTNSS